MITSESVITSLTGFAVVFAVAGAVEKWETPEAKAEAFSKAASSPSFPRLASANSFTAVAAFSAPKSVDHFIGRFCGPPPPWVLGHLVAREKVKNLKASISLQVRKPLGRIRPAHSDVYPTRGAPRSSSGLPSQSSRRV